MTRNQSQLIAFARGCLEAVGMPATQNATVAEILVEADLMGHDTHGLALLPGYVAELQEGKMLAEGTPEVASDSGAAVVWDGGYLSGVWLTAEALDEASRRASAHGTGTVVIRRSHHIACLQAYLHRATDRGQMAIISCSDPRVASVAPYGGIDPVFTPNPIACGIPTDGDPILIDFSASITTNGMTKRLAAAGKRFPGLWAVTRDGTPTDDPAALSGDEPGALLPVGGLDHGHKGYALAIMIEAMTQALAGHGRADEVATWGASVFVQVFDPTRFAGTEAFQRQSSHLVRTVHTVRPMAANASVRLPGENAQRRRTEAIKQGLSLPQGLEKTLSDLGTRLGVAWPG